ncbi:unnamed protein product [Sphagnum tenellum]
MAAATLSRMMVGVASASAIGTPSASPVQNADLQQQKRTCVNLQVVRSRKCSNSMLSLATLANLQQGGLVGIGMDRRSRRSCKKRSAVAMVAVPTRPVSLPAEPDAAEGGWGLGDRNLEPLAEGGGGQGREKDFDPSARPPFTLADIRAAIPKHCWEKNTWKSMSFLARDVAIVFGLAAGAAYLNTWFVWPLYWLAQGTMFWALFVLGHDCGHGSFSNNKRLNNLIGHLTHSTILVPYNGWRISHRTHHQNHGHVDNDESWHPIPESIYRGLDFRAKTGRLSFPWSMFTFPIYLWTRSPGKTGTHFDPKSDLFMPNEGNDVRTSTACWTAMLATLVALTFAIGPMWMLKLYVVPYLVNVVWLDAVTYLHHHGYDKKVPWYRGAEWNYMQGGLSTIDRDYGWFNNIHHDIGTHVVHHLFPQIPHYNLVEATESIKPIMGEYYRDPKKSGPIPVHLLDSLIRSLKEDHFVSDEGDVVYYQSDPNFSSNFFSN